MMSEESQSPEENSLTPAQQFVSGAIDDMSVGLKAVLEAYPDALDFRPKEGAGGYVPTGHYRQAEWFQGMEEYFTQVAKSPDDSRAYCETRIEHLKFKKTMGSLSTEDEQDFKQLTEILNNE